MGSKKNRRYYRNQHRFTFHRKRPSWKRAQDSIPVENRPPAVEVSGSSVTIDGSRIINIANLEKYISELSRHIATCCNSTGNVMLTAEKRMVWPQSLAHNVPLVDTKLIWRLHKK